MVSEIAYKTFIRVVGVVSLSIMAILDNINGYRGNDIWYGALIATIVIGPHALDILAGDNPTKQEKATIATLFIPVIAVSGTVLKALLLSHGFV